MLNSFTEIKSSSPIRTFLLNATYAQGVALLLSLVTVIMDNHGEPRYQPNIGKYSCWLGSEYSEEERVSFASTPEFLYYYLIIIFIILINIICFLRTGFSLFFHWWQMRGLAQGSINELFKTQVVTLAKLFVIMGIPWIVDVVSAYVKYEYNRINTYDETRLALSILNLLQGVLIFITLLCKPSVYNALKNKIQQIKYSPTEASDNIEL